MRIRTWRRLVLPALFLVTVCGCGGQSQQPPAAAQTRMAVPVTVAAAVAKSVPVEVSGIGNVEPYSTVSVKSLVAGELRQVHFSEGEEVRRGALLFSIDPRPFENELERARANLARDTAQLKQAEASLARDSVTAKNAAVERDRYGQLVGKGVASAEAFERLQTSAETAEAAVRSSRAAIDSFTQAIRADQAAIQNAALQLEYCSIRSPIDGRTGSLAVYAGNLVKANDNPALVVIHQIAPVRVNFSVPEQNLPAVRRRMAEGKVPVAAVLQGDEDHPVQGALSFIENAVDATTGTIRLKATFQNADRRLWPGQFVSVTVLLGQQSNAVVVPSQALQTSQAGPFVFVVKADETAEARPVAPGRSVRGETVIDRGLQAGETVVTDGQSLLVPGARVSIKGGQEPKQEQRS